MVTVRNDFGQTEEIPASFFFRTEEAFEEWESVALRQCGPRVLDIGAGVGAHALVLQGRGHEVTALDLIPEAVRIMKERGVEDAREGTLFELRPGSVYDTVILLMNGSMIAETLPGLDRLLAAAALRDLPHESASEPGTDLELGPEHDDRYFGELHYQLSVGEHVGEVFPQLFIDPETLEVRARRGGWRMEVLWSGPDGRYLARLRRRVGSVPDDAAGQDGAVSEALA